MTEPTVTNAKLTSRGYKSAFQQIALEIERLTGFNHLDLTKPDVQFAPAAPLYNLTRVDRDTLGRHFKRFRKDRFDGYSIADPDAVFDDKTGLGTVRSAIKRLNATDRMKEFGSVASPVVNISPDFDAMSVSLTFLRREPAF